MPRRQDLLRVVLRQRVHNKPRIESRYHKSDRGEQELEMVGRCRTVSHYEEESCKTTTGCQAEWRQTHGVTLSIIHDKALSHTSRSYREFLHTEMFDIFPTHRLRHFNPMESSVWSQWQLYDAEVAKDHLVNSNYLRAVVGGGERGLSLTRGSLYGWKCPARCGQDFACLLP